ncbi:MAG: hypothetical protein V4714_08030, partial [Bacteroidota bacterium]
LTTLISCNKSDIQPSASNQVSEQPALVDGKLEFSSLHSFGDFIKTNLNWLTKMNPKPECIRNIH